MNFNGYKISSSSTYILLKEAERMGFEIKFIDEEKMIFKLSGFGQTHTIIGTDIGFNSSFGFKIARNKQSTYKFLGKDFPIPKSFYFYKKEKIDLDFLQNLFPLVVKPIDTDHGIGVTVNINSVGDLEYAIKKAFRFSGGIIVQEFISGNDYRVLVIDDGVFAVVKREAPKLIGDGMTIIKNLIKIKNDSKKDISYKIDIDDEVIRNLDKNELDLNSILEEGKVIYLRANSNLSTGGDSYDMTDIINEKTKQICIDIAKKTRLKVVGIDIICNDISLDLEEQKGKIIEINAGPGFTLHHFVSEGEKRNVAKRILGYKFNIPQAN